MAQQRAIDLFNEELRDFIDRSPDICTFENWMLNPQPQNPSIVLT